MAVDVAKYKKIAQSKIHKPGQRPEQKRILVYGRNKKGKSFLSATAPNVLMVDPEGGNDELVKLNPDIWQISSWEELNDVYRFLQSGEHEYKWVVFDGLTRISNMALKFVMNQHEERSLERIPGMVQQRDYGKAGELMKGLLYNMQNLPMGIIYTTQERQESPGDFGEEDADVEEVSARQVPDLPKGVRSAVNGIVDVIGRIYTVRATATRNGKEIEYMQRRLWIAPTEAYDTGYRSSHRLPDYIKNPTVPKIVELINTGRIGK